MLDTLAQRCVASRAYRHALFGLATAATLLFLGYYVGTFDQAIHIPFLKKYADPSLYPNDPFFDMRFVHYSYFWFFFLPFYQLGVLEIAMFAVHALATYLTYWALWSLSRTLFDNPLAALLTVVAFIVPHAGFAGFTVFEFSLLNRTFVLPFLLIAFNLYLRGRVLWAFLLLGLMYNLHVISVNFALAMLGLDALLRIRRVGWRSLLGGMALFALAALPVVLWKLGGSPVDFTTRWEWYLTVARGLSYSLFFLFAPYPLPLLVTVSGFASVLVFLLARRAAPPPRELNAAVTNFVLAGLIIILAQAISASWYPATIVVQSQIIRAGVFILIFSYLYAANWVARLYQTGLVGRRDFAALAAALALSVTPALLLVALGIQRFVRSPRWRPGLSVGVTAVSFLGFLIIFSQLGMWRPGISLGIRPGPWYEVQVWARDNTPREALFITPPHLWGFYDLDWRVVSERSTVVTLYELLEIAFEPSYLPRWQERFHVLAPGADEQLAGDFLANDRITAEAYYSLSESDLERAAARFGATYLVIEKPHERDFPIVYQNDGFTVYRLRWGGWERS